MKEELTKPQQQLLEVLARAYCVIDQKWEKEIFPVNIEGSLFCKTSVLDELKEEIFKLRPELKELKNTKNT